MTTFFDACKILQRFGRVFVNAEILIQSFEDFDTHWLFTYAVADSEDPSRIFATVKAIVEKETGDLYYGVPRLTKSSDWEKFPSNRQAFQRVTQSDLDKTEEKKATK